MRSAWRCVCAVAVAVALLAAAGCERLVRPVDVAYPSDPRVLHGAWQLRVTGLDGGAYDVVYAPTAGRLVAWFMGEPRTFEHSDGVGWTEVELEVDERVAAEAFDPSLEAFVAVEFARAEPRVRVTPVDGRPESVAAVALPDGHALVSVARGSGRAFALTRAVDGLHLSWWDAVSGAFGGTRAVRAPHGMRVSSNGRALLLWSLQARRVEVVDTQAPERSLSVPLGACTSDGVSEVSADGRWFVLADCAGRLRIADLSAATLATTPLGFAAEGRVTFSLDGAALVWRDAGGAVHAFDPLTGSRRVLGHVEVGDAVAMGFADDRVVVHHGRDVLALVTARGAVGVLPANDESASARPVELPAFTLTGAALALSADPIDQAGAAEYAFRGSFTASLDGVDGEALPLVGTVFSRLHRFVPDTSGVARAAPPPAMLVGVATVASPDGSAERFVLSFWTRDADAAWFEGSLHADAERTGYRVRLERPEAGAARSSTPPR